ncbi:MAG: hypothetical protein U0073_00215 [Bacteroidia bacterium]
MTCKETHPVNEAPQIRPHQDPATRLKLKRRLTVIAVCFFIASIFWLLISLSHEYPTELTFPVSYQNLPGKKVVVNDLPEHITILVKTSGFKILSYDFQKQKKAIEIDVAGKLQGYPEYLSDALSIATASFTPDFTRQLGNEVNILGYTPDSIVFNFSDRIQRRLPVKLNADISYEKQYDSSSGISVAPDSITVSGPPSVLQNMKYVETERLRLTDVKAPVYKTIGLAGNKLLTFETESVVVKVPVEKFTEGRTEVSVHPMNVETGYSLKTFPDKITVRYQVALSKYNDVNAGQFDAVVDAGVLREDPPAKLKIQLMTAPSFVRAIFIEPEKVDYILRKK